jgi:hypothetical protein
MIEQCPICRRNPVKTATPACGDFRLTCELCGRYDIGFRLAAVLAQIEERTRMALAAHSRQANQVEQTPCLLLENYEALARQHLHTSISRKLQLMLDVISLRSKYPGDLAGFHSQSDFLLIDAASAEEADYFFDALRERGDIDEIGTGVCRITPRGWDRLEPLGGGAAPGTCFVAMSFKPEMNDAYDLGIRPAVVDDCGFEIIRVDRVEHVDNINDRIMADLRRAQFVVADFTKHPAGVYFEAGFALGLGRLVFWTCQKDDFTEKVHFDTRPYNHILWSEPAELRERLTARIRALLQAPKP